MNTITSSKVPVVELPSGEVLSLKVIDIVGKKKGPMCYLQASVHGAEHQGNAVIYQLLKYLEKNEIAGSIRLVPMANPIALNNKIGTYTHGRFNSNTGDNWNRLYHDFTKDNDQVLEFAKKYLGYDELDIDKQYKLLLSKLIEDKKNENSNYGIDRNGHVNILLQELAHNADYVLDLHTGPVATRYLYVPEYLEEKCADLQFPHNLIIPNNFAGAMDEASFMPWINLQRAFKELGRDYDIAFEAYTVELGSEERISLEEAQLDLRHILHYLFLRGIVTEEDNPITTTIKKCKLKDYKTYYAPRGALYEYMVQPGQAVKKGEVLAVALNFENHFKEEEIKIELRANQDCIVINHYPSSSVPSGAELFQVMESIY